jgi:RNA polymerase sigma-70 factor, ECF subfamily
MADGSLRRSLSHAMAQPGHVDLESVPMKRAEQCRSEGLQNAALCDNTQSLWAPDLQYVSFVPATSTCNRMTPAPVSTEENLASAPKAAMAEGPLDVPAWVVRVRLGDEDAARALLNHLYPLVITIVRGHLPRRTSEEDLAQMIFVKVFAKLEQFSGTVPLAHWVSRIAVNTCLNALQAEKIRPEMRWADLSEEEEHVLQSLASTSDDVEPGHSLAAREIVNKLLEYLNPNDRLLVQLLHMQGRSVEEIRQITGWNISLIKVRAFRARRKLRKHLVKLMKEKGQ